MNPALVCGDAPKLNCQNMQTILFTLLGLLLFALFSRMIKWFEKI
jgi:hypothetical protein